MIRDMRDTTTANEYRAAARRSREKAAHAYSPNGPPSRLWMHLMEKAELQESIADAMDAKAGA